MKSKSVGDSFKYAWAGVKYAARTQRNIRIHFLAAIIAIIVSLVLRMEFTDMAIMLLTIFLVIFAEMINTAVEVTVDLACQEIHPLAEIAKNVAAGAVLVTAIAAVVIGILVVFKYIT